jgi:hypothetical protein
MMQPLRADDQPPPALPLRALVVPIDHPEAWPQGDWQQVSSDDYAEFVEWLNQAGKVSAPSNVLSVAEYSGEFNGVDLIAGSVTFDVASHTGEGGLVPLGEFSPRIEELAWDDGAPAVWGAASDQASYLWADREHGRLSAEWSQQGERFESEGAASSENEPSTIVRFDIVLPHAISSRLRLRVPASHRLHCTVGVISETRPGDGGEFNDWTIECGSSGRVTFVIAEAVAAAETPWLADLTTLATAKSDGLQFDAELTIESSDALPAEINLRVPRDLRISSVRTGSDLAVEYHVAEDGARGNLRIVPPAGVARRATFRIRGMMPISLRRPMVFPFVAVPESSATTASWTLKVDRPLELRSIVPQGLRQTALTVGAQGESWQFLPFNTEPRLAFEVGLPEMQFEQRTWSLVDLARPVPEMNAVTSLRCLRGAMYSSAWRLPADWLVAEVESQDAVISTWTCDIDPEQRFQTLSVEYRDPVEAGEGIIVEIRARSRPWRVNDLHPLPLIECAGSKVRDSRLAVRVPPGMRWTHDSEQLAGPFTILNGDEALDPLRDWLDAASRESLELWTSGGEDLSAVCRLVSDMDAGTSGPPMDPEQDADDVDPGTSEHSLKCRLMVETFVAETNRSHHRHQCRFELAPHDQGSFQFTLAPSAEVLSIFADGLRAEPRVQNDIFHTAISPQTREVQIDYLTPASPGTLTSDLIPLPRSNFSPGAVEWKFLLPADRGIAAPPENVVLLHDSSTLSLSQRLLGPLARPAAESIFGIAGESERAFDQDEELQSLTLVAAGDMQSLRLDLWKLQAVRSATWTSMLGAFLLLLSFRRLSPRRWPYGLLAFIAAGFATAWIASPPIAVTAGGALMGALLAAAVPRRMIQPSAESGDAAATTSKLATPLTSGAVGMLLMCWMLSDVDQVVGSQIDPAGPQAADAPDGIEDTDSTTRPQDTSPVETSREYDLLIPMHEESQSSDFVLLGPRLQPWYAAWHQNRRSLPSCLIHSAAYRVDFAADSLPTVAARFEVFMTSDAKGEILLPLRDVVVVGAAQASLNGEPVTLIPESGGSGFLLSIPEGIDLRNSAGTEAYVPATIDLSFRVRSGGPGGNTPSFWSAGIPRVSQTNVVLSPQDAESYRIEGVMHRRETNDELVASLPPSPRLSLAETTSEPLPPDLRLVADSTIEIGPDISLVSATLRLEPLPIPAETRVLPVHLPPRSIIRDVRPAEAVEYFIDPRTEGVIVWLVLPQSDQPVDEVVLEYALVDPLSSSGERRVPPLNYHPRITRHRLEMTPRSGYEWAIRPQPSESLEILGSDELTDEAIAISTPDTIVARVRQPHAIACDILPVEPLRKANLSERLEVGGDAGTWTADLVVESIGSPSFEYLCQIDSSVTVSSVTVERDGADRLLRWSQDQDRLLIFTEGDQPGTHDVRISGTFALQPESVFQWPRFSIADVDIESSDREMINRGARPLMWDAAGQGESQLPPGDEVTIQAGADRQGLPANLRFESDDDEVHAAHAIWITPSESNDWNIHQRFVFNNDSVPVPTQTVRIPESWTDFSEQAIGAELTGSRDSQGRFVRLEGADGESAELILSTQFTAGEATIPIAWAEGVDDTVLFLPRSAPINSPDWTVDEGSAVGAPPAAFEEVREWGVYRPSSPEALIQHLPAPLASPGLEVLHAESDVYVSDDAIVGETRYDISIGRQRTLLLKPLISSIQAVSVDGIEVEWGENPLLIPLPDDRACVLVTLSWTAESPRSDGRISLSDLVPLLEGTNEEPHYLCCWNQSESAVALQGDSDRIGVDDLWLARWEGLLLAAERLGPAAARWQPILWRIGQCERSLAGRSGAESQSDAATSIDRLSERWRNLRASWPAMNGSHIGEPIAFGESRPLSWDAASDADSRAVYRVVFGSSAQSVAPIPPARSHQSRLALGGGLTLVIVVVVFWGLRQATRRAWNDRLAAHPHVAWLLLGIAWWLFLSPSVLGVMIILLTVVHAIYRRIARPFVRARRSELASTVSRT